MNEGARPGFWIGWTQKDGSNYKGDALTTAQPNSVTYARLGWMFFLQVQKDQVTKPATSGARWAKANWSQPFGL
jgi:hypothetical protein